MATQEKESLEYIPAKAPEEPKMGREQKEPLGSPPTPTETTRSKTTWQKLADFVETIPVVGPIFKFFRALYAFAGIKGISCLLIGVGFALLVFNLGKMPDFLIVEKYRGSSVKTPQSGEVRTKPIGIGVHLTEGIEWARPHVRWLEIEGDDLKGKNVIKGYMARVCESGELSPTTEFKWILKASPGFEICGFGFRLHDTGSSKFFEQLNPTKEAPNLLSFHVPKCEKGDKVVAIIRTSWEKDLERTEFLSTFSSNAE